MIALVGRDAGRLKIAAGAVSEDYPETPICIIPGDVSEESFANAAVSQAMADLHVDSINILVCSAAIQRYEPFWAEPSGIKDWWKAIEIGLRGPALFTQAVLHTGNMLKRKSGTIISIGSDQCWATYPGSSAYGVAKSGLLHFHQNLELETRRFGIQNFYVMPGLVDTRISRAAFADVSATFVEETRCTPARKAAMEYFEKGLVPFQSPELGADTVVTLCVEDDASLLSGTYVDAKCDLYELFQAARNGLYEEGLYTQGMKSLEGYKKWSHEKRPMQERTTDKENLTST